MNRGFSLYLDLIRFLSAIVVFFVHASYERFIGDNSVPLLLRSLGNDAVMVFFVLSGYVIAHVANQKEFTLSDYISSRLARLYSVVIPALLLTVVFDFCGKKINPEHYSGWWFEGSQPLLRLLASSLFLNEIWFSSIRAFSNGPFWSLGYEFWYYLIFAFCHYLKGRLRIICALAVVCIAGPKILLLFPVWFLGVLAYKLVSCRKTTHANGLMLMGFSALGLILFRGLGGQKFSYDVTLMFLNEEFVVNNLGWSKFFLGSYVIGSLIAINFVGVAACASLFEHWLIRFEKPIRYVAGFTFSLYLMHYPCLMFFSACYPLQGGMIIRSLVVISSSMCVCWVVGSMTENKKKSLKTLFSSIFS